MVRMLVALTVFFLFVTLAQIGFLHWEQRHIPSTDKVAAISLLEVPDDATIADRMAAATLKSQILLEFDAVDRHFRLINVVIMGRLWIKYLGFLTGMIIALIGATFVLGKMREAQSEVEAENAGMKLVLKSASPGLIMVAAGTALMLATTMVHHRVNQSYKPMYANAFIRPPQPLQRAGAEPSNQQRDASVKTEDTRPTPSEQQAREAALASTGATALQEGLDEDLCAALRRTPSESIQTGTVDQTIAGCGPPTEADSETD